MTTDLWTDYTRGNLRTDRAVHRAEAVLRSVLSCIPPPPVPRPPIRTVLEVGANVGVQLEAIHRIWPHAELMACEPNDYARSLQPAYVRQVGIKPPVIDLPDAAVDMVLVRGVLSHIPADRLEAAMAEIRRVAARWIVCGEYYAAGEEEGLSWKGRRDLLWGRDWGRLWTRGVVYNGSLEPGRLCWWLIAS